MELYLGICFSLAYILLIYILAISFRPVGIAIVAGGTIRLIAAWLVYIGILTSIAAQKDSVVYERVSREWAAGSWHSLLAEFDSGSSYVISWFGAVLYKLMAPSPIMLNIVNAFCGTLIILLTYLLAKRLIGSRRAYVVSWIAALFPFAVLYASAFRREVFGAALFTIGLIYSAKWQQEQSVRFLLCAILAFSLAMLFHGTYALAIAALGLFAFAITSREIAHGLLRGKCNRRILFSNGIGFAMFSILALFVIVSGFSISEFGNLGLRLFSLEDTLHERISREPEGGSAYPPYLSGDNLLSKPWIIPGRIFYFLFSPFPWDIRDLSHVVGLIASLTFIYIAISLWKSRRVIVGRTDMLVVLFIVLSMIVVFGIAVDNIGTAIRHRTKFIFSLLALCYYPVFTARRFKIPWKSFIRPDIGQK